MTNLFNGVLKEKFKHPLPNQDGAFKALARGHKKDDKTYDIEINQAKIPLPTELLKYELDKDDMLIDTLLNICDKNGVPFKWKYLTDDLEDVMELIQCEEFFDKIPMSKDYSYFVARDWIGVPINKYEIDSISRQRKIFEKRAIKKVNEYNKKRKNQKIINQQPEFKKSTKILEF